MFASVYVCMSVLAYMFASTCVCMRVRKHVYNACQDACAGVMRVLSVFSVVVGCEVHEIAVWFKQHRV